MESQTLGEQIPVVGTPFSLNYVSDRTPGYIANSVINIPVTGAMVPFTVINTRVTVEVVGQKFVFEQLPAPNITIPFTWDGLDVYGRLVIGGATAHIKVEFEFDSAYRETSAFGNPGDGAILPGTRTAFQTAKEYDVEFNSADVRGIGLGGWTLDQQHYYDPLKQILYLGNGNRRSDESMNSVITTVIGGGGSNPLNIEQQGPLGVSLNSAEGVVADDEGNVYASSLLQAIIVRLNADGSASRITSAGDGFTGDGGPAVNANVSRPQGMTLDSQGNLYIADSFNHRIRMIDTNGIISTVAGSGPGNTSVGDFSGDGGPATSARLNNPSDVAIDSAGNLYILDGQNLRIRKVDTNGIIHTVAGNGTSTSGSNYGEGGPAVDAQISPQAITIDPDDNLIIGGGYWILKVDKAGIISTVAGTGPTNSTTGPHDDGILATDAVLNPLGMVFDENGNLFIADNTFDGIVYRDRIRVIDSEGIVNSLGGSTRGGSGVGDNGPAGKAKFNFPNKITFDPEGNLFIAEKQSSRIRKIAPPLPGFSGADVVLTSQDGTELYLFDPSGRHLKTINTSTGADVWVFAYDTEGRLSTVTNGDGDITTFQRDVDGNPTGIVSADGQSTVLALDTNGYLNGITNPANETNLFEYTADGLMTKRTDPRFNVSLYTYNTEGKLTHEADPAGGTQTLARTGANDNYIATNTSAMGRVSSFAVDNDIVGGKNLRTNIDPSGFATTTLLGTDQSQTITTPNGTQTVITNNPDPRWGMQAPLSDLTVTTPGGLISNLTTTRNVTLADPVDPLSMTSQTDTLNLNGHVLTSTIEKVDPVNNPSEFKVTDISQEGKITTSFLNEEGRIVEQTIGGFHPISFVYDTRGRVIQVKQGTGVDERIRTIAYNTQGLLDSVTDPEQRIFRYEYDVNGRLAKRIQPDLREIAYTFDAKGNIVSISPPSRPAHNFSYTSVDLGSVYTPPIVPGSGTNNTIFNYNLDRQLTSISRPDNSSITYSFDTGKHFLGISVDNGLAVENYTYDYFGNISGKAGRLEKITVPDGGTLTFDYDGPLLLSSTWGGSVGAVPGNVSRTFDADHNLLSQKINGANEVSFSYDGDGLLTQAKLVTENRDLLLNYDSVSGLLSNSTFDTISDSYSYNGFGEITAYTTQQSTNTVFSASFVRDKLGRITQKTENVQGVPHVYDYLYYSAGWLKEVKRDSVITASYTYDANGNRTNNGAVLDDQDRLISTASTSYEYSATGVLSKKIVGSQETLYEYDPRNNLRSVTLPSGTSIEYILDGLNRVIGKKVNGALEKGWLYDDMLNPIAELDGSGNIISRFIFAAQTNTPDFMLKGGTVYRIISDHLGSPRLVIDATSGVAIQAIDYDEWGHVTGDTNPGFQPFGFAGGLYDQDTKLVHFGARDYDPGMARWTAKDPIPFANGRTNLYAYALNDPINFVDLTGTDEKQKKNVKLTKRNFNNVIKGLKLRRALQALRLARRTPQTILICEVLIQILEKKLSEKNLSDEEIKSIEEILGKIENGESFPFRKDGTVWENRDGDLPNGNYKEYTVETPGSSHRGKRRVVREDNTDRTYYSDDHYETFVEITDSLEVE